MDGLFSLLRDYTTEISVCGTWNVNLTRFNILCNEKSPPGDIFNAADMPEDNGVPA